MSDPAMIGSAVMLAASFSGLAKSAARRERSIATLARDAVAVAQVGKTATVEVVGRRTTRARVDRTRVLTIASVIAGAVLGTFLAGPIGAFIAGAGSAGAWVVARRRRDKRRAELLEMQLADAVTAISAALRAGLSVSQAVGYAAEETDPPLADTLRHVADQLSLGVSLDTVLERWADQVGTDDALLVNGVLALHRRTGGDLPRVLDRVAETLAERRETAREVRGLTAQARLSGAILGFLPIGFFLFLVVTSRRDISAAFHSGIGIVAIGLGFAMQGSAFVWIRRLLRVA